MKRSSAKNHFVFSIAAKVVEFVCVLGAAGIWLACERKAPGPEQCYEFALRSLGITDKRLLTVPEVSEKVDVIVTKCLTTPYDKQLLRCVKEGYSPLSCFYAFEDRERRRGYKVEN
jgi:hypothetical protein